MDVAPALVPPARDWSELPLDVLSFLFAKVGAIDALMGAGLVCHSWLQAAKAPDMWRCVKMEEEDHKFVRRCKYSGRLLSMAKVAVDRSDGQLQMFAGERFVTNELLIYIAESCMPLCSEVELHSGGMPNRPSPSLKSLCLKQCHNITDEVFIKVMQKSPLLELECLELVDIDITNQGLTAILDNCPRLEILDIYNCCGLEIDDDEILRAKCDRIKTFHMGNEWDYDDDYGYEYSYYDTYYYDPNDSDHSSSSEDANIESWTTPEPI